jgi:hypothetical protein
MVLPATDIQSEITSLRTRINALRIAVTQLENGTIKSYTVSDGQVSQSVTKKDSWKIDGLIEKLLARLSRLLGGGTCNVR